jgi:hypothetical protein
MPCQWMVVGSGSLFVTRIRTRSPSMASIVGPGVRPLYPQHFTFMPGANSCSISSAVRWYYFTPSFMTHGRDTPFGVMTEPAAPAG